MSKIPTLVYTKIEGKHTMWIDLKGFLPRGVEPQSI
jgi:hypothetical protein